MHGPLIPQSDGTAAVLRGEVMPNPGLIQGGVHGFMARVGFGYGVWLWGRIDARRAFREFTISYFAR